MTVFSARQVFPVDYVAEVSQRLLEASHSGDLPLAFHCIADPSVDVNFAGAVTLKTAAADLLLLPESPSQVRLHFQEFVSDVSPLFLAVHAANAALVRKLLVTPPSLFRFRLFYPFHKCGFVDFEFEFQFELFCLLSFSEQFAESGIVVNISENFT
uniref:Uncharacterized protein n=1 Tax=Cajanus cajan TaxID=3821 RepID=A0A151RR17_CAJCA|nr:hypothetical protein KK1_033508 [Cajanus cajan]